MDWAREYGSEMESIVIIKTTLILLWVYQSNAGFCPLGCLCVDDGPMSPSVECDGANLDNIPILFNPRIRSLVLSNNRISSVTLDELGFYTELELLDLSNNKILTIERGAFYRLQKLRALRLSGNQLSSLAVETFAGLNELRALDLSENGLARLATSIFSDLRRLETLNVSKNSIAHVSPGALTGLTSLKELHLQHNELRQLPKVALHAPQALKILDLSFNRVETIGEESFLHLRQLESLNLAGNDIDSIEERAFIGLRSLRHLNLDTNRLHRVPTLSFRPLTELNSLSLGENLLEELTTSAFEGLSRLRHLTISRCPQLKSISLNAFSGLFTLEVLILTDNPSLSRIDPMAFELLQRSRINNAKLRTSLRQLYIFGNNLTSLPKFLLPWRQLDELDLRSNPWRCDCEFGGWIGRALRRIYVDRGAFPDGAICRTPDSLRGRHLHTIRGFPTFDDDQPDEYEWAGITKDTIDLQHCPSPWSIRTMDLIVSILPVLGVLLVATIFIWLCIRYRRRICDRCPCCENCFENDVSPLKPAPPGLPELFRTNGHELCPASFTMIRGPEAMYAGEDDMESGRISKTYQPAFLGFGYVPQPRSCTYYREYETVAEEEAQTFLPRKSINTRLGKLYANTSDYYSGVSSSEASHSPPTSSQISPNSVQVPAKFGREGSFRIIQRYPIPITEL